MRYVLLDDVQDAPWNTYFRNKSSVAIGAMDGEVLAAYAVYSKDINNPAYIYLDYIYTISEYRERYVASDMLEYMEDIWRGAGFEYVIARIVEEDAAVSAAYSLIKSNYFISLQEKNKIFVYRLCDMMPNERIEKLLKLCSKNTSVVHIGSRRNKEYAEFAKRLKKRGTNIEEVKFDIDISCFYRGNNGKIDGCMLADRYNKDIMVKYIYINGNTEKYAVLYMLCELLKSFKLCGNVSCISVILSGKKYIDLFMYFFPQYFKSYDIWDYILEL